MPNYFYCEDDKHNYMITEQTLLSDVVTSEKLIIRWCTKCGRCFQLDKLEEDKRRHKWELIDEISPWRSP